MSKLQYNPVEAQNLSMGQNGSILVTGTNAITCKNGVL